MVIKDDKIYNGLIPCEDAQGNKYLYNPVTKKFEEFGNGGSGGNNVINIAITTTFDEPEEGDVTYTTDLTYTQIVNALSEGKNIFYSFVDAYNNNQHGYITNASVDRDSVYTVNLVGFGFIFTANSASEPMKCIAHIG